MIYLLKIRSFLIEAEKYCALHVEKKKFIDFMIKTMPEDIIISGERKALFDY